MTTPKAKLAGLALIAALCGGFTLGLMAPAWAGFDEAVAASTPAIWSAIAASFAALSSFLILLILRRNLLESVRPELVLTDWNRRVEGEGDAAHDLISFQTIRNVGRGAALNIHLSAAHISENRPIAILPIIQLSILPAGEASKINGEIVLWWKNVNPGAQGHQHLPITVVIFCWDSRGMRHETRYSLFASELSNNVLMTNPIAPGVMLTSRTTTTRAVWLLKLFTRAQRLPGLSRSLRKWLLRVIKGQ